MILLALIFLIFPPARAQMIAAPFWQARQTLNFTTTSQTIFNLNCSGITTIQNRRSNVAVNVSSNVVIDLAATDTTFYSDADCANPITSITMASGTSSVSFYFISATTGAKTVSATAPRYIPATQSQTVNTNGFIWIGGAGCDGNWATGACWSGGVAPSAASQIVIDGSCTLNCSPTISANISIAKVRLTNSCSSTITQANGVSITVTGWYQDCGTFVGGNAASPVTINGNYSLVGGNYTATAGTWTVTEDFVVQNTPVFSANAGLLTLSNGATTNSLTPGAVTYNNVKFNSSSGSSVYTISGTMTVAGTLTLASTNSGVGTLSGGTIVARGDVIVTNYGCNGGTIIQVTGATTGTSNIDGSAATSANLPTLEIVAGVNTVNLVGTLNLRGAYTYTSGTVSAGTSTLVFGNGNTGYSLVPGDVIYKNISFSSGNGGSYTITGTMTVAGTLTLSSNIMSLSGGTIVAQDNVIISNNGYKGSTLIKVTGASDGTSTIDGSGATTAWMPALEIVAGVNTVNLVGTLRLSQAYTYTSGTVSAGTSTLVFDSGPSDYTLTPGAVTYNNVKFNSIYGDYIISGTMTVAGTLTLAATSTSGGGGTLTGGTIVAQGNVTITNYGYDGSTLIKVTGATTGTSTIDGSGATTAWMPALEIVAGVNTVNLVGTLRLSQAYTYTSGTVAAGTSTLVFSAVGVTHTVGTVAYNNVTISGNAGTIDFGGGTMTINGNLALSASGNTTSINSGTLNVAGNVTNAGSSTSNTSYSGTAVIKLTGNAAGQTITGTAGYEFPNIEIAAGANNVTLAGTIQIEGTYTLTSVGTLTVTGSTLVLAGENVTHTVGTVAYNNVTISGNNGTIDFGGGTMTINGNLALSASGNTTSINSGTLNVAGNVTNAGSSTSNTSYSGTAVIKLTGNAAGQGQTITGTAGYEFPNIEIAAGANNVTLAGTITIMGNYTLTSVGTLTATGSTLVLNAATGTITPGTVAYNNVTFSGASGTVTVVGTMTVGGNLTLSRSAGTRAIDGGTLDVLGNVIATTPSTGTTNIKMSGGTAATITGGNFTICGTSFEVDKAGSSVSLLTSALNYDSVGQTFTLTAGSMDMAGLAMTVKALSLNGTTLTKSAGVLTVNSIAQGTGALFGGIVNP